MEKYMLVCICTFQPAVETSRKSFSAVSGGGVGRLGEKMKMHGVSFLKFSRRMQQAATGISWWGWERSFVILEIVLC